ncbi:Fic family protein [Phaeobacter sp. 11ANDIMAR09]|uniref:Fic/DOC family protein n=1 Tax=Phaeobacter sp. 11ANDIMAR09 TaxID=1225647 RepID=UPI0009F9F268|nr:Fic family protein [Phaeobacter sp. 11ANDIMAR09]
MSDPVYCLPPDHKVLRNKFDISDQEGLDTVERELSTSRIRQGCPEGDFDLKHLQSIHHHLFQDTYEWAGEVRTLEISKGGSQFMPRRFIENGMNDIHGRIISANYLQGTSPSEFSEQAGELIGDLNHVHPFREGNGRTQMQFLQQLSEKAGHKIDLCKIDKEQWIDASISSNRGDHSKMQDCIQGALEQNSLERDGVDDGQLRPQISAERYKETLRQSQNRTAQLQQSKDQDID